MQTLKTAAIVVLMMAVIYGAYVSLTTPSEPLPADVQDMLVINGDESSIGIDAGLPESLGGLDINSGNASTPLTPSDSGDSSPVPGSNAEATDFANLVLRGQAMSSTPMAANGLATPESSSGITGSVGGLDASPVPSSLPPTSPMPPSAEALAAGAAIAGSAAGRSYPTTGDSFNLPDPNSLDPNFSRSGVNLPDPNLALASGVSESESNLLNGQDVALIPTLDNELSESMPASTVSPGTHNVGLANAIRTADQQYADDKRQDALATLSLFYNTPHLSGEQRSELLSRLDPLAREVIYSKRHLLEQPHRVGQNETLVEIAAGYEVPWQLLANINEIDDPVTVLPGTELKVVRGPFRAEVNLASNELTLFLGDLYAGRFPVGIGSDPMPKPGTFTIQDKQTSKTYYNAAGSPVSPASPENPYGEVWMDLGSQLSIHGSPSTTKPTTKGCISLAADYADDLYGILSQGSSVTIRR